MRNKKRWLAMMLAAAMAFTAPGTSLMGTVSVYATEVPDIGTTENPKTLGSLTTEEKTLKVNQKIYLKKETTEHQAITYTLQSNGIVKIEEKETYMLLTALKPGTVVISDGENLATIVVELAKGTEPSKESGDFISDDKSITLEDADGIALGISETDEATDAKIKYSYLPDNEGKITISGLKEGTKYYVWAKTLAVKDVSTESAGKEIPVTTKINITGKVTFDKIADKTYKESAFVPGEEDFTDLSVKIGATKLNLGTDFTCECENNVNAGTATVKITGKGKYCGTASTTFVIKKKKAGTTGLDSAVTSGNVTVTENSCKVEKVSSKYQFALRASSLNSAIAESEWRDVTKVAGINTIEFANLNKATSYTLYIRVKATSNSEASDPVALSIPINIPKASIADATVKLEAEPAGGYIYNGLPHKPKVNGVFIDGKEVSNSDYTVKYVENECTNAGTASFTIVGKNNYEGTKKVVNFNIAPKNISDLTVQVNSSEIYSGDARTPGVSIVGLSERKGNSKEGDFTVKYENNVNVGVAKAIVTGVGNYTGTVTKEFNITQLNLTSYKPLAVSVAKNADDSDAVTMNSITVEAKKAPVGGPAYQYEYAISKDDNITDSTKLTWQNSTTFTGLEPNTVYYVYPRIKADTSVSKNWTVSDIGRTTEITTCGAYLTTSNTKVTVTGNEVTYDGSPQTLETSAITVKFTASNGKILKLEEGEDYEVSYKDAKGKTVDPENAGTYSIYVTGINDYSQEILAGTFTIKPKDISLTVENRSDKNDKKPYDGTNKISLEATVPGEALVGDEAGQPVTITGTLNDSKLGKTTLDSVDASTIKINGKTSTNYTFSKIEVAENFVVTIEPAEDVLIDYSEYTDSLTYGSVEVIPVNTNVEGVKASISLDNEDDDEYVSIKGNVITVKKVKTEDSGIVVINVSLPECYDGTYNDEDTASFSITTTQATPVISLKGQDTSGVIKAVAGSPVELTPIVKVPTTNGRYKVLSDKEYGTLTITYGKDHEEYDPKNSATWPKEEGVYSVKVALAAGDNVNAKTITATLIIGACEHDNLKIVEAVEATCEDDGNIAYTYCPDCKKYFNMDGAEITVEDTVVKATGHKQVTEAVEKATFDESGYTGDIVCEECGKLIKRGQKIYRVASVTVANGTYNGKAQLPKVVVKDSKGKVLGASDYSVVYKNNVNAGKGSVVVTLKGKYAGTKTINFTIAKAKQSITKAVVKKTLKASLLKKKAASFKINAKANGKVSYAKVSGSKNITVSKAGTVKIKKGTKKGTYTIKVKITAAATSNFNKATVTKTIKVVVK